MGELRNFKAPSTSCGIWNGVVSPCSSRSAAVAGPGVLVTNLTATVRLPSRHQYDLERGRYEQAAVVANFMQASV